MLSQRLRVNTWNFSWVTRTYFWYHRGCTMGVRTSSRGPPRCETSAEICIITDRFSNLPSWNAGVFRYTFQLRQFNDQLNVSTNRKRDERPKTSQVSFITWFNCKNEISHDLRDHPPLFELFLDPSSLLCMHTHITFLVHTRRTHKHTPHTWF